MSNFYFTNLILIQFLSEYKKINCYSSWFILFVNKNLNISEKDNMSDYIYQIPNKSAYIFANLYDNQLFIIFDHK